MVTSIKDTATSSYEEGTKNNIGVVTVVQILYFDSCWWHFANFEWKGHTEVFIFCSIIVAKTWFNRQTSSDIRLSQKKKGALSKRDHTVAMFFFGVTSLHSALDYFASILYRLCSKGQFAFKKAYNFLIRALFCLLQGPYFACTLMIHNVIQEVSQFVWVTGATYFCWQKRRPCTGSHTQNLIMKAFGKSTWVVAFSA